MKVKRPVPLPEVPVFQVGEGIDLEYGLDQSMILQTLACMDDG